MSGDSKIGQIGNVARTGALRRVANGETAAMRAPHQAQTVQDNLPAARLTRLAGSLAGQSPPVDVARVAALRNAIGNGSYGVHAAIVASAMLDYHSRGAE